MSTPSATNAGKAVPKHVRKVRRPNTLKDGHISTVSHAKLFSSLSNLEPQAYIMYHEFKTLPLQCGPGISLRLFLYAFPLRLLPMPRRQSQNMAERYASQTPQKITIFRPPPMQSYCPRHLDPKAVFASLPRHLAARPMHRML